MPDTLTVFQGDLLKDLLTHGPSKSAEICSRTHRRPDKSVDYKNSTIMQNLIELVSQGFVGTGEEIEGALEIKVTYYFLTDRGRRYVSPV